MKTGMFIIALTSIPWALVVFGFNKVTYFFRHPINSLKYHSHKIKEREIISNKTISEVYFII